MSESKKPPGGRFRRLGKMASLTARLTGDLLARGADKLAGERDEKGVLDERAAAHLVESLGEMKGAAMKLGQMLSMDPQALTDSGRKALAKLQSQAPRVPWEEMQAVLHEELGERAAQLRDLDPHPIAAASIGQVYRAVAPDGTPVAVKVQYPGMTEVMGSDLDNLGTMIKALGVASRTLDGKPYLDELRTQLNRELDYRLEAAALSDFQQRLAPWPDLGTPRLFPELCARRVLTTGLVDGKTLSAFLETHPDNAARLRVSSQLVRAVLGPMVREGVIHADPHPGNFLVVGERLVIVDFGAVKHFSPEFAAHIRESLRVVVEDEPPADLLAMLEKAGFTYAGKDRDEANEVLDDIHPLVRRPVAHETFDYATSTMAEDLRAFGRKNLKVLVDVRPPPEAMMFFRALAGTAFNLRSLGAKGPFREIFAGLLKA